MSTRRSWPRSAKIMDATWFPRLDRAVEVLAAAEAAELAAAFVAASVPGRDQPSRATVPAAGVNATSGSLSAT